MPPEGSLNTEPANREAAVTPSPPPNGRPSPPPDLRVALESARASLVKIWFMGSGVPLSILIGQIIVGDHYNLIDKNGAPDDQTQAVVSWFIPMVFPTLSLMIGVIAAGAMQQETDNRFVRAFYLQLSKGLSNFYIALLVLVFLGEAFGKTHGMEFFSKMNFFLGPVQSLVLGSITILFTSQEKKE